MADHSPTCVCDRCWPGAVTSTLLRGAVARLEASFEAPGAKPAPRPRTARTKRLARSPRIAHRKAEPPPRSCAARGRSIAAAAAGGPLAGGARAAA